MSPHGAIIRVFNFTGENAKTKLPQNFWNSSSIGMVRVREAIRVHVRTWLSSVCPYMCMWVCFNVFVRRLVWVCQCMCLDVGVGVFMTVLRCGCWCFHDCVRMWVLVFS